MTRHRVVALVSVLVVVAALAAAALVTSWALVVVPFALVVAVAAWRGVGPGTVLDALGDSTSDAGRGPAGLAP